MPVQSILVSRFYTLKGAIKIVEELNEKKKDPYVIKKVDITEDYYRFRQYNPEEDAKYITKESSKINGVKFIIQTN